MFGQSKHASDQKDAETENKLVNQQRGRGKFARIDREESSENFPEWFFENEDAEFNSEGKKKKSPAGAQTVWPNKD